MSAVPLPPLPPAPRRATGPADAAWPTSSTRSTGRCWRCVDRIDRPGPGPRAGDRVQVLTAMVSRHLSAEEQYLLPSACGPRCRDAAERVDREIEADRRAADRPEGARPAGRSRRWPTWPSGSAGTSTAVGALVAPLREVATEEELIRLGNRWRSPRRPRRPGRIRAPRPPRRGTGSSSRRSGWWTRCATR